MNKLRPPDFPGRNLPGRIRRGIPQKIRTGIGIPEKLPIFADTISHESGSAAGGPDFGFHTGCNEKGAPPTRHPLRDKVHHSSDEYDHRTIVALFPKNANFDLNLPGIKDG